MSPLVGALLAALAGHALGWSYADQLRWGEQVTDSPNQCATEGQSPINIDFWGVEPMAKYRDNLPLTVLRGEDSYDIDVALGASDRGWEAALEPPVGVEADTPTVEFGLEGNEKERYTMKQFRFNSPSEHTVNGNFYPLEMQMTHKTSTGKTLIIAVLFRTGTENEYLKSLWSRFPQTKTQKIKAEIESPYTALKISGDLFATYKGSLTMPPCTHGVDWIVMLDTAQMSLSQIQQYREAITAVPGNILRVDANYTPNGLSLREEWNRSLGLNNRVVQPLGGRKLRLFRRWGAVFGVDKLKVQIMWGIFIFGGVLVAVLMVWACCHTPPPKIVTSSDFHVLSHSLSPDGTDKRTMHRALNE